MSNIKLYNTLTREKENFKPIKKDKVGIYTCGPTVYNYAHIGNLRTYLFEDFLVRTFKFAGYKIKRVMNITDVGHLTGDRDKGEDKLEEGAKREGKSAWDIARYYAEAFKSDMSQLNIMEPDIWVKATDTIPEQIDLIKTLEEKDYTYKTSDGVYYDTSKFKDYNKLSHLTLEDLQEGARVEKNEEKRNATDFALWKFSPNGEKRQMEWESPWGIGFPGWHAECSVMSAMYLSDQLDIHCGGIDHINVHHTNEIAQSEAATGKPFFNYWIHGAFLNISGGKKMAKSEDNFLTLNKAFEGDALVYRFAALGTHYRKPMEYSPFAIESAKNGLKHLRNQIRELGKNVGEVDKSYNEKFLLAITDDLNMPQALAVVQEMLKSDISNEDKLATTMELDKVLGLSLDKLEVDEDLPREIKALARLRRKAREEKRWDESDELRKEIEDAGFTVEDTKAGMRVFK